MVIQVSLFIGAAIYILTMAFNVSPHIHHGSVGRCIKTYAMNIHTRPFKMQSSKIYSFIKLCISILISDYKTVGDTFPFNSSTKCYLIERVFGTVHSVYYPDAIGLLPDTKKRRVAHEPRM